MVSLLKRIIETAFLLSTRGRDNGETIRSQPISSDGHIIWNVHLSLGNQTCRVRSAVLYVPVAIPKTTEAQKKV
jgi:hypothetical protein